MSKSQNLKITKALEVARNLHSQGQLTAAISAYKKTLRMHATHPDALHYLGLAYYQSGDADSGIKHVKRAITLAPNYPDALSNLANIYKEMGRQEEAYELYAQVLKIAPQHTNTLVNTAIALRENNQADKALHYLQQAIKLEPQHAIAQHNLGNVYSDLQQTELALKAYTQALELDPQHHHTAKNLAHLLQNMGRTDEAIQVLKTLILQRPNDAIAKHLLAAFGGNEVPDRASDQYVKQTFDTFSASFDATLARLQYTGPQLVSDKLRSTLDTSSSGVSILDIGCGTGLCGTLLKPIATTLIGVDLSPKMLQIAKQLKVYDELFEAELSAYMQSCQRHFDYVVCADTFVYIGALHIAFDAAYDVLNKGGYLIFTVEQQSATMEQDYSLQANGRYSHNLAYLRRALVSADFEVCSVEDVVLRMENGKVVDGALIVAIKH
jgi:predicted TPR repeat methyltransferase